MEPDLIDLKILKILEKDSNTSLKEIGRQVGIFSASAISRRIKALDASGIIRKHTISLDVEKLGMNFITITFVRAKYDKGYVHQVARKIENIRGVISVFFLLGDIDFVLLTVNRNKEDYENTLNSLTEVVEIERSDSRTVLKTFKQSDYSVLLDLMISDAAQKYRME